MISPEEAQLLLQQGRVAEAERAFAAILGRHPDNVAALNFMSLAALRTGDLPNSLAHIGHALRIDAHNPVTLHNQGRVLEAAQHYEEAAAAQRAALRLAPNLHAARLYLGRALELSGDTRHAIAAYARAMQDAQADGRWLNKHTTPAAFQALIEHAVQRVRSGRRAAIDELLEPLRAVYGSTSLRRVEAALRLYFNEEPRVPQDSRQHPTFFHLPDIPASPYLDLKRFPWIEVLEEQTSEIQAELCTLIREEQGRERVFTSDQLEAAHLRGLDAPPSWNGYYFFRHGETRFQNQSRCPKTTAALRELPLCHVRDHGPEVLFSVFTPGTHLLPHRGVTNARVVGHLPLIVPERCALVVGGEEHRWREGKVVVFDDTYEHEAWNRSSELRIVLIFDLWSPFLDEAERTAIGLVFGDIGDFRQQVETAT